MMAAAAITTTAPVITAALTAVSTVAAPRMATEPVKSHSYGAADAAYRRPPVKDAGQSEQSFPTPVNPTKLDPVYRTLSKNDSAYNAQAQSEPAFKSQVQSEAAYKNQTQIQPVYRQILPKSKSKQALLPETSARPTQVSFKL
jgi:hypothetical protein